MSPTMQDLRRTAKDVINAAVAWAKHDYGELGELEAAAALADAVLALQEAADRAGLAPGDALSGSSV